MNEVLSVQNSLISSFHLNLSQQAHVCIQHLDALLRPNTVVPFELGPLAQELFFKHYQVN